MGCGRAAGAFVDGTTLRRSREHGLDVDAELRNNNSYTFFAALGVCAGNRSALSTISS